MRIAPPLYSTVSELHDDLVKHAMQAFASADYSHIDAHEEDEKRLRECCEALVRERMAQIAGAVWMEAELDREDACRAGIEFVLVSLTAKPAAGGVPMLDAAVNMVLRGAVEGIREALTKEIVREIAKAVRR